MAILKTRSRRIVINLNGADGNAFSLMAHARNFYRQLNWPQADLDALLKRMMSSDYENLITEFDCAFGAICDLERD